jgi:hypothetical protein
MPEPIANDWKAIHDRMRQIRRNNPHPSGPVHSATVSAGYLISRTVGTQKRSVMLFAEFALTRAICPRAGTSPTDDKNIAGAWGGSSAAWPFATPPSVGSALKGGNLHRKE